MKKFIAFLLVFIFGGAGISSAQLWNQTDGPSGNTIKQIVFNKNHDIFVLSQALHRSTDHGASWHQIGGLLFQNGSIHAFAIEPNGDIYVTIPISATIGVTANYGAWKSTDNGETWKQVLYKGFGYFDHPINYLFGLYSPIAGSNGTINIGASKADSNDAVFYLDYRSTDNGNTWDSSIIAGGDYMQASGADANGNLFYCMDNMVFRSTDDGKYWSKLVNGLPAQLPQGKYYRSIAFAKNGVDYLAAGSRSTDGGRVWTSMTNGDNNIVINSAGRIMLGTLQYSDDSGQTWKDYGAVYDEMNYGSRTFPVFGNDDGDSGFYISATGWFLYGAAPLNPWKVISLPMSNVLAMICAADGSIVATSKYLTYFGNGMWRSTDNGASWGLNFNSAYSRLGSPGSSILAPTAFAIDSNKNVIAGSAGIIFRSEDNGSTFQYGTTTLTTGTFTSMVVSPNGDIFASSSTDGVYRSTDHGDTWDQLNNGFVSAKIYSLAVNASGDLFAGSQDSIYKSIDDGLSWQYLSGDTARGKVNCLTVNSRGVILAGITGNNIYWSRDNGKTWSQIATGLTTKNINALLSTPSGYVFAATDSGVFTLGSEDYRWLPYSLGLTTMNILSLTHSRNGQLFAGSDGSGVFSSVEKFDAGVSSLLPEANGMTLFVLPNPIHEKAEVHFSLLEHSHIKIECLDILGRSVAQVVEGDFAKGDNSIPIDLSNLPSGEYVLRLSSDKGEKVASVILYH